MKARGGFAIGPEPREATGGRLLSLACTTLWVEVEVAGPGRPTRDVVGRRRAEVARCLARSARQNDCAAKSIARELGVGVHAVRKDLEFLAHAEPEPSPSVPLELANALKNADTCEALSRVERMLVGMLGDECLSPSRGRLLLDACRELRQTIKGAAREQEGEREPEKGTRESEDARVGKILAAAMETLPALPERRTVTTRDPKSSGDEEE
jgi:hypothetical protein